LTDPTGIPGCF